MIHYLFLIAISAMLLPTISGIPFVPHFSLFFWLVILYVAFLSPRLIFNKSLLVIIPVLIVHIIYIFFDLYSGTGNRRISDIIIPYVVVNTLHLYYIDKPVKRKNFLILFVLALTLTSITSTIALQVYPDAARMLAGSLAAQGNLQLNNFYLLIGIGSYTHTIAWVFSITIIVYVVLFKYEFIKINIIILLISLVLIQFIGLITLGFGTSFFLLLFSLTILLFNLGYIGKIVNKIGLIPVYMLIGSATLFFGYYVSPIFYWLADILNNEFLSPRLNNIAMRMDGSLAATDLNVVELYQLERENVYLGSYEVLARRSLNSFLDNPVFGGGRTGGHNYFLDLLGMYGLIGFVVIVIVYYYLMKRSFSIVIEKNDRLLLSHMFVAFIILGIVKTYSLLFFFITIFFVVPYLIKDYKHILYK